ncbi:hypothetical protein Tco_0687274 [Tanacetum coccineum]
MMITYLKNMDSEKEENKLVEPESEGKKGKIIKRVANSTLKQKSSKKQKMMQEQESAKSEKIDEELQQSDYDMNRKSERLCVKSCPDDEETVDTREISV